MHHKLSIARADFYPELALIAAISKRLKLKLFQRLKLFQSLKLKLFQSLKLKLFHRLNEKLCLR